LEAQEEYLRERLGIARVMLPQLPVIPLGVHVDDFSFSPRDREEARKTLGVSQSALIVLFVGRLSFHAKAHPLAMYQALGRPPLLDPCKANFGAVGPRPVYHPGYRFR